MAGVAIQQRISKNRQRLGGAVCTPGQTGYKRVARAESTGGSRSRETDITNRQARAS